MQDAGSGAQSGSRNQGVQHCEPASGRMVRGRQGRALRSDSAGELARGSPALALGTPRTGREPLGAALGYNADYFHAGLQFGDVPVWARRGSFTLSQSAKDHFMAWCGARFSKRTALDYPQWLAEQGKRSVVRDGYRLVETI